MLTLVSVLAKVARPTAATNQLSSSDSNDDNSVDDDTSNYHVAADEGMHCNTSLLVVVSCSIKWYNYMHI